MVDSDGGRIWASIQIRPTINQNPIASSDYSGATVSIIVM
jgi:hypothetical protein